eukprot:GHVU01206234.1.p3 GENE.GHVU01206234.1~~GHVU01206234.1.p3  ORF type:complete len:115 (-),score=20.40 GHVU01206234.1:763-1107(-)
MANGCHVPLVLGDRMKLEGTGASPVRDLTGDAASSSPGVIPSSCGRRLSTGMPGVWKKFIGAYASVERVEAAVADMRVMYEWFREHKEPLGSCEATQKRLWRLHWPTSSGNVES